MRKKEDASVSMEMRIFASLARSIRLSLCRNRDKKRQKQKRQQKGQQKRQQKKQKGKLRRSDVKAFVGMIKRQNPPMVQQSASICSKSKTTR